MYPGEIDQQGFSTAMVLEAVLIFFWVSIVMGDPPIAGRFISWKKRLRGSGLESSNPMIFASEMFASEDSLQIQPCFTGRSGPQNREVSSGKFIFKPNWSVVSKKKAWIWYIYRAHLISYGFSLLRIWFSLVSQCRSFLWLLWIQNGGFQSMGVPLFIIHFLNCFSTYTDICPHHSSIPHLC